MKSPSVAEIGVLGRELEKKAADKFSQKYLIESINQVQALAPPEEPLDTCKNLGKGGGPDNMFKFHMFEDVDSIQK